MKCNLKNCNAWSSDYRDNCSKGMRPDVENCPERLKAELDKYKKLWEEFKSFVENYIRHCKYEAVCVATNIRTAREATYEAIRRRCEGEAYKTILITMNAREK